MLSLAKFKIEARKVASERLGQDTVQDVSVSDYLDEDGDKAILVSYVIDKFDPDKLSTEKRLAVFRSLVRYLGQAGDDRLPLIQYVESEEMADLAAND